MMNVISKIENWFYARNLQTQNPKIQMCKLMEEAGELAKAINKNNMEEAKDGIGDCVVVLVGICTQLGLDFSECVEIAYNEIKDRKGKLIDGTFVKEADLH